MGQPMVFLVLSILIPARSGGYIPQYIPMPSMEECRRVAPLILKDATTGFQKTIPISTPWMTQARGSSEMRRGQQDITVDVGVRRATVDCREF